MRDYKDVIEQLYHATWASIQRIPHEADPRQRPERQGDIMGKADAEHPFADTSENSSKC